MKYLESPWYRTGDVRIAPGWFGFMQAQELWRRDSYDSYGEVTMFETKWKRMGPVPFEVDRNFYSVMATKEGQDWYIWKQLIRYLPGAGRKDPVPSSPSETQERLRNYERKAEEEKRAEDGYAPDPVIVAAAAKRDPNYAKKVRAALGDPRETVHLKPGPDLYGHIR